ncbi:hypothetical protein GQ457_02G026740 [Hibiscus cannabinus]
MLPLLGPSVLGESRSQGCAAKAPYVVCLCAAKAPRARWRAVCAVLGGSRNLGCAANPYAASAPCAGFSQADLWALHYLPCKLHLCSPSPTRTRFTRSGFLYKTWCFASRIYQCRSSSLYRLLLSHFSFFDFLCYSLYMDESLLAKLGDLNFTAEEQDAVVVVPESVAIHAEDFACSLVGRVLSSSPLDGGRVARLFRTIWKDDKVQTITKINPNFFLIAFASASNRDNVLKRGPWDFQKHWFALEPADPACTIHDYAFRYMCIWVRIHNIPLSLMTEALARTLGACIGKVVMTDTRLEDGNMGEFLRVRVSLDTTKPLRRCVTLSHSNAKKLQYGAWLRAPLPKRVYVARPHGRVLIVKDAEVSPLSPAPSVASSPPASASAATASVPAPAASDAAASDVHVTVGRVAAGSAPISVAQPHGKVAADDDGEVPYDPMLHPDVSDVMEDSLDIPKGCTLFSDIDGMVQSTGLDDVIDEAADALLHDVASSILGQVLASSTVSATVVSTSAACSSPLPSVSRPASTCARRLSMPSRMSSRPGMPPRSKQLLRPRRLHLSLRAFPPAGPLLGRTSIIVDLLSYSPLHIDVVISYDSSCFRFTGMHGRSESTLKKHNWALIDRLWDASPLPWVLGGDFNEILSLSEKQGGLRKPHHQMTDFRECLLRNDLADYLPPFGNGLIALWLAKISSPAFPAFGPGPSLAPIRTTILSFLIPWRTPSPVSPIVGGPLSVLMRVGLLSPIASHCVEDLETLLAVKGELRHLLNVQEVYWAQRSRVLWLSAGDCNTSFFHAKASARRRKNAIQGLHDAQGLWRTSIGDVLRIASDYFMDLFSAGPSIEIPTFLEHISPSITNDMNSVLTADFTAEEVWFFPPTLGHLGDDFVSLCLDLLRGRIDMASVNETVIVLIPKVDKPTSMRQLRPISLSTVIYKTVLKVLVNRMKSVLPNCISSTQDAFVQGRAITDNILVAHELVHTLHTSVSRSSQGAVFKLDMEKAFDRVEWPFLKVVMLRLGFAQSWVDLIMRCVSSVSSRVRLRGTLFEAFLPRRGLRQGVPLSPFLFLFCTEGLLVALTAAQREGHLPDVRASKHGPPFNHLLFAYDSLVFMRNDMSEVHYLKDISSTYSAVSEQKFNFSKSTAYFSPRTPSDYRVSVHEALGVQEVSDPGIYLGDWFNLFIY